MVPIVFPEYVKSGQDKRVRVMLVDCPNHMQYHELASQLHAETHHRLQKIDVLIIRPRVDVPMRSIAVMGNEFAPLISRAPNASLHVLYSDDFSIKLSANLNLDINEARIDTSDSTFTNWLRHQELKALAEQSGAIYAPHKDWLYRAPNGKYANMFMRVGNVQRTRRAIDAFFFWMLPHLENIDSILSETWSVSSIAFNTARFLERYWSNSKPSTRRCRVDILSSYHDRRPHILAETREALHRVAHRPSDDRSFKTLVMLSAISTGQSLDQLRKTIEEDYNIEQFKFVSLYKLTDNTDISTLCDLSEGVLGGEKFNVNISPRKRQDSIIEIDGGLYFPKYGIQAKTLQIKKAFTDKAKAFFSKYRGLGAFTFHRDTLDDNRQRIRHHGIYIDVRVLLKNKDFIERIKEGLRAIGQIPRYVIVPPHETARSFSNLIRELLISIDATHEMPTVISHPDLEDEVCRAQLSQCNENDLVLVVDDVCIKGWRLKRYQRSLRNAEYRGRIAYMVGVARPPKMEIWDSVNYELTQRIGFPRTDAHSVFAVETVLLPDLQADDCPWCAEMEALRAVWENPKLELLPDEKVALARRISELVNAKGSEGLNDNVFWLLPDGDRPQIGPKSLFIEHRRARSTDVMGAVMSTIQSMRDAESSPLEGEYPFGAILNRSSYLGRRFNDIILRCAILRAVFSNEVTYWQDRHERERGRLVLSALTEEHNSETLHLEFAVARLAKKLPTLPLNEDESTVPNAMHILKVANLVA